MEYLSLYIAVLKQYVTFSGRTGRKEYWSFFLISLAIGSIFSSIDFALNLQNFFKIGGLLSTVYSFLVLIPTAAVSWRRLHDIGRKGWWTFLLVIPILGPLAMIYFWVQPSQPFKNEYGFPPKI